MDEHKKIIKQAVHLRHSSKIMKQVTSQCIKEGSRDREKSCTRSQRNNVNLLIDAWNRLPDQEKAGFASFASHARSSLASNNNSCSPTKKHASAVKENYLEKDVTLLQEERYAIRSIHRSHTLPVDKDIF